MVRTATRSRCTAVLLLTLALAASALAPAPAAAQREGPRVGLRGAAYFPVAREVRRAFPDVLPLVGIAVMAPLRPGRTQLYPSIEAIGARSGRNRFFILPLTFVVERQGRGRPDRTLVPYARVEAGIAYFDYRLARAADTVRARRGGAAGGVEAGMVFTPHFRTSVRYRAFQELDGLDFGGAEVGVVLGGLRLF